MASQGFWLVRALSLGATGTVPRKARRVRRKMSLRRGFTLPHADLQPTCFILFDSDVTFTLEIGLSPSIVLESVKLLLQ